MRLRIGMALATLSLLLVALTATAALAKNELKDVQDSANVLRTIMKIPEKGIPPALLKDAQAIVIVPDVIKGAFIVGGATARACCWCASPVEAGATRCS
jgi:lipid-binding SYLF domain-containing protein